MPKKENHEHKGGRRNFSALGRMIWISYSFLLLISFHLSQSWFKTVLQCFFLLGLQRKSEVFFSAAKVLCALTIIKMDWNPLLFLSTQTDQSSTPYNKCLKKVWDESSGWASIKKPSRIDSEAKKHPWSKTNCCQCWAASSLLQLAAWAGLTLQCSHTHSQKSVLLGRERFEQEKMHNLELGWFGHWSVWCRWFCLPTNSLFQLWMRMCSVIKQPGTANPQDVDVSVPSGVSLPGENAAREAVTHSLSRGSSLSSGSFLPLCTLCRKERYQLIRYGRRPPPNKKASRGLNVY